MKYQLLRWACASLGLAVLSAGCKQTEPSSDTSTATIAAKAPPSGGAQVSQPSTQTGSGSNSDPGIVPMGGAAISPVTNPGAVDGEGSNVGQMAKEKAKTAAEKSSQTDPTQTTDDN